MDTSQPGPVEPKAALRAMQILCKALIAGALLFGLICIGINLMQQDSQTALKSMETIFLAVHGAIAIACLLAAVVSYRKGILAAKEPLISLEDKLNQYRNALIRYLALCEMPALLGIILFFLSGYYYFLLIAAIMIALMQAKAPTRKRITEDLALDWKEQQEFD